MTRILAWTDSPDTGLTVEKLISEHTGKQPQRASSKSKVILLTSGTTGTPKGAKHSGGSPLVLKSILDRTPWRAEEPVVVVAPMFHAWGFSQLVFAASMACTIVTRRKFDPEATLELIDRHRATGLCVVPVMFDRIMELPDEVRARYSGRSLRFAAASGSRMRPDVVIKFMDQFGDVIYNNYNATEAGMIATATPQDLRAAPDTAGKPAGGTEIRILDPDFREVPTGETGSIYVRNSTQFDGYTSGKTKEFHEGFMSSGDVGYLDDAGRLFVVGRDDEMIVSGGENVYPIEVEKALSTHPDVAEASVIGVDDEQFGQRLAAFVVLNDGAVRLPRTELKQHVRENLANYKVPRGYYDPRRTTPQQHRQDRAPRAAGPRRPCVGAGPLLRATAELLNAANGVRPLGREGYITIPVFAFGWPTTEMSPLYLAGSVLDAVRRGLRGDFRGARGRIALLLTAIAWALLWLIQRRNVASEPHFEEPLREALGDDYETIAAQSQPARRRRRLIGVPPNDLIRRRYVEKAGTVQYGPHPRVNFADIWRRADLPRDGKAPVLLQVPGGAWAIGMRRPQAYPLLSHLADRGWVCVSIDYRVSPRHTWPDHIVDVKRALAWIKENIADYGGDPEFVAITGGSAGGHLASLAALTPDDPQCQPGFEDADTSVVAAVPIYGRYDWVTTQGLRPQGVHRVPAEVRGQEAVRGAQAGVSRRVADQAVTPRCATVFHSSRRGRLDHPGARGPRVRRGGAEHVDVCRRVRRDPARPTRVRLLLRVAARRTTPPRRWRSSCPGCTRCAYHRLMKRPLVRKTVRP